MTKPLISKDSRNRYRSAGLGAVPMAVVLFMLTAAFMPTVGAQYPDLVIVTEDVQAVPEPLVVGVPAAVTYNIYNYGVQNAYAFNVSLFDHGLEVATKRIARLNVGENISGQLPWTPEVDGTYNLLLKAWYGPTSSKRDEDWDSNNHTFSVTVLTRPDVYLTSSDLSFDAPNPSYVVDGETVTVKATVHNAGTSPVIECNVSLWEADVGTGGEWIDTRGAVSIPALGQTEVSFLWNTTGWSGKRLLYVDVTDVLPEEEVEDNNRASMPIKIHTQEDRVFESGIYRIRSDFKVQYFMTIKGTAELIIEETGNVTVFQDFDDQYDIEVMGNGKLSFRGGLLNSEFNYTVFLFDDAVLDMGGGSEASLRVSGTGDSEVHLMEESVLTSATFELAGGRLTVSDSTLVADAVTLTNIELEAVNSTIEAGETIVLVGRTANLTDTEVKVIRAFKGWEIALGTYPQLEFFNPETREVPLPPAIMATDGARVNLYNVSADSMVHITSENSYFWSSTRLAAEGRTSIIHVFRYLDVEVRDWSDQPVPQAEVEVLDYFEDEVVTSGTTDGMGDLRVSVRTDYVTAAQKPFVGNLRIRATAYERTSEDIWFSHNKYPVMRFDSNVMTVRIEMPPNPSPEDPGTKSITIEEPTLIEGGTSGMDKNIIVDNTELAMVNTTFTLEQEFDFQWYIKVKGQNGMLRLENSTLLSSYRFKIYLEDGGVINVTRGSSMPDNKVRIIAQDETTLQIVDSEIEGRIYTDCSLVEFVRSDLLLTHTRLDADVVSILGGRVHETADMLIKANEVTISEAEVSADYELHPSVGADDLDMLVRYSGWFLLNDLESISNISHGYFTRFADESNITIDARSLSITRSFIYAVDTNILVQRLSLNREQATFAESMIGGINLVLQSDDLYARDCSFNRVLDNFAENDRIRLESVEVPGIVCSDSAIVERYWFLTVFVLDGAGSITTHALLEVFSTETNDKIFPKAGEEDHPGSRTNTAGRLSVPILANVTDSTGDYFVGSVYFWLKFDGLQFATSPIYTPPRQLTLKSDVEVTVRFSETITSPEKEISYVIYNLAEAGESMDLRLYHHTFENDEEAVAFLSETLEVEIDRYKGDWVMIRNTTVHMTFFARQLINNVWEPLADGRVRIAILQGPAYDPNQPALAYDNSELRWEVEPDDEGYGSQELLLPDTLATFRLYIAISGGAYDQDYHPARDRFWNFSVEPPQTIHIASADMNPSRVEVGSLVTITGYVRYIYTNDGVEGAEVKITGTHISESQGRTDAEGRYAIQIQAPILVMNNLTMTVSAIDPKSEEEARRTINYDVVPIYVPPEEEEFPWGWVMVGIIVAVLAFAISFGAVMMYRRHYGEVVECGECGAFIPATSTTCPKCGIEFETDLARCSECEAWIPANSSSCPVCGTAFTIESLEEQVAREEAEEDMAPIDQVTTTTAQLTPLTLEGTTEATKWSDREEKRRRRIKKRVKKRLTVTDATDGEVEGEGEAKDLFVGDEDDLSTRLPGLGVDESMLSDEELSRLLPTEDMLKDLMLTTDQPEGDIPPEDLEVDLDEGEEPTEVPTEGAAPELEGPPEMPEGEEPGLELEEIEPPEDLGEDELEIPEEEAVDEQLPEELGEEPVEEGLAESQELLSELGLVAPAMVEPEEGEEETEESSLSSLLTEDEGESKEAPKLCPNCGGNWILYKDGEYTCRICGERW